MTKEEYIETLYVNGTKVDVGLDDYGQCYFFEYTNEDGKLLSLGCGTYNTDYLEEIYYTLDPYNTQVSLYGIENFKASTDEMYQRYLKHKEEYTNEDSIALNEGFYLYTIKPRLEYLKKGEFIYYDFEKMYKEREKVLDN